MGELKLNKLYNNYRYTIPIPGGIKANVFIVEDENDNPHTVICSISKSGTTMSGYGTSVSRLLSYMIQNLSLDETISVMSDLSLDLAEVREEKYQGQVCRSLPEAITIALREYRKGRTIHN